MAESIFLGVAWPYANGPLHLGQIAGAYLPADIFARFHRSLGNRVLMVSGSDQHGTPIMLRADRDGTTPQEVVDENHAGFLKSWEALGISWDLYTSTGTENHRQWAQSIFSTLLERGYLFKATSELPYSPASGRYLPDRYVTGTCPHCGFEAARGDQCDNCGKPLDPKELIDPKSSLDGSTPEFREREHYMLQLTAFEDRLKDWLKDKTHWRPNVLNFTNGFLAQGLKDRGITRDLDWGVPVPLEGWDDRRIYVWFEAVIGYLSASVEWAQRNGTPDAWKEWWGNDSKAYYFLGKDNIPFHTIIWPAMLMGYDEDLALPHDVPANEFLNLQGEQLSTSRNWAVWVPDYLESYPVDALRYVLAATMPETSDSDFNWRDYVRRNNNELVGTFGNLVHRVLTFLQRNFNGVVPTLDPDERGKELLTRAEAALEEEKAELSAVRFRAGLAVAMALAQDANRYLDERAPWRTVREDRTETERTLGVVLSVISTLKTLFYPFLPFSAQKLHELLGFDGEVRDAGWRTVPLAAGARLPAPEALFIKMDEDEVVQREMARLG
ncbi:MAG: methionine--tRNA ligase [Dehalococcoidia bacterium]|jgi:methionyl-tRNA synthetase|nr:methionine--tRNA ligase [Dehalococcoidia bacterium]